MYSLFNTANEYFSLRVRNTIQSDRDSGWLERTCLNKQVSRYSFPANCPSVPSFVLFCFFKNLESRIFMRTLLTYKCWLIFLKNKVICGSNKIHLRARCTPLATSLESLVSTTSTSPLWNEVMEWMNRQEFRLWQQSSVVLTRKPCLTEWAIFQTHELAQNRNIGKGMEKGSWKRYESITPLYD